MLEIKGIEAGYGAIQVLKGVDLKVQQGEIVTLIGANGAGKTTLLKVVSGILAPTAGQVLFNGEDITRRPPHRIMRRGIFTVQEGRAILKDMSVQENLLMGGFSRPKAEMSDSLQLVFEMFPILKERQKQLGGTLSGGQQQMLALGRALMARPRLYMMDEPSLGLAPRLVTEVFEKIVDLKTDDVAILLVEQNARKALQVADRGYVLDTGRMVLSGTGEELSCDQRVSEAYLGGRRDRCKI